MYKGLCILCNHTRMSIKRCCLRMIETESLPLDVVEHILERLPVKSLMRFKAVSKQWRSTIESRIFEERQFKHRQLSADPDVLMVSLYPRDVRNPYIESLRTLVLCSSSSVNIPAPWENSYYLVSQNSFDGLVCIYHTRKPGFIVNPTIRWHWPLPLCNLQKIIIELGYGYYELGQLLFHLVFGKDKINGTYKPVWLYNSSELGLENATTCEVFDFSTNSWRYVTPSAPYRIVGCYDPVCVDGSLHWFTEDTKVISFNLHTEAFQVVCKAPFAIPDHLKIVMCNLDNRLCVSEMNWPNQVIWSFNSDNKTWDKMFSIDLSITSALFGSDAMLCALQPLVLFGRENNNKLLFYSREYTKTLVMYDLETKSYGAVFSGGSIGIGNPE